MKICGVCMCYYCMNNKKGDLFYIYENEEGVKYISSDHPQPERLNPEDHIVGDNKMICDSLNSMETWRERLEEVSPPNKSDQKK